MVPKPIFLSLLVKWTLISGVFAILESLVYDLAGQKVQILLCRKIIMVAVEDVSQYLCRYIISQSKILNNIDPSV